MEKNWDKPKQRPGSMEIAQGRGLSVWGRSSCEAVLEIPAFLMLHPKNHPSCWLRGEVLHPHSSHFFPGKSHAQSRIFGIKIPLLQHSWQKNLPALLRPKQSKRQKSKTFCFSPAFRAFLMCQGIEIPSQLAPNPRYPAAPGVGTFSLESFSFSHVIFRGRDGLRVRSGVFRLLPRRGRS